jgi:hypothetical protein
MITKKLVAATLAGCAAVGFGVAALVPWVGDSPREKTTVSAPEHSGTFSPGVETSPEDRPSTAPDKTPESPSESPATTPESPSPRSSQKPAVGPSRAADTPKATVTEKPVRQTPKPAPSQSTIQPTPTKTTESPRAIYKFFIPDDTEQNRTWCDTRPSGATKVVIGTMYRSFYNDQDPAKAFESYGFSKEDEVCP